MIEVDLGSVRDMSKYFAELPEVTRKAASLALNQTAERTVVKKSKPLMRQQVAFPAGYLERADRLGITKYAKPESLDAAVTGRFEQTSLARFARFGAKRGSGALVTVKPGSPQRMKRAFPVNLRGGNVGLAMRLKKGEELTNRRLPARRFGPGIVLLYGPSVDQVFRTVSDDVSPMALEDLSNEFFRQFVRLNR